MEVYFGRQVQCDPEIILLVILNLFQNQNPPPCHSLVILNLIQNHFSIISASIPFVILNSPLSAQSIEAKLVSIKGQQVLIDRDVAQLY